MQKFIITSEEKQVPDSLGTLRNREKRGLFYFKSIGKRRIYRDSFKEPAFGMIILEFKEIAEAERVCNKINEAHNDDFKVEPFIKY